MIWAWRPYPFRKLGGVKLGLAFSNTSSRDRLRETNDRRIPFEPRDEGRIDYSTGPPPHWQVAAYFCGIRSFYQLFFTAISSLMTSMSDVLYFFYLMFSGVLIL
jgi:hypothetical protein